MERMEQERQEKERERQEKERAQQRLEDLEAFLRSRNIDPNNI